MQVAGLMLFPLPAVFHGKLCIGEKKGKKKGGGKSKLGSQKSDAKKSDHSDAIGESKALFPYYNPSLSTSRLASTKAPSPSGAFRLMGWWV